MTSKWRGRRCPCGAVLTRHCKAPSCHWYDCPDPSCEWLRWDVRNSRGIKRDAV
jgi:hypothetical protein